MADKRIRGGPGVKVVENGDGAFVGVKSPMQALPRTGTDPIIFVVEVVKDGGSAGNSTTACSFTYTVKHKSTRTLLTAQTPECQRPSIGKMVQATRGLAYRWQGTLYLFWVDEVPAKVKRSCP